MMVGAAGARFSVVIVNYNGGAMLTDCVHSVVQEGVPVTEIIIVDNGSRDNSLLTLERSIPATKIIRNSCNAGFAFAVNQGLAAATGDFILLLNNDAQLQPGALRAFAEAFDLIPNLAIAGGQLYYGEGQLQTSIAALPTLTSEFIPQTFLKLILPRRFRDHRKSEVPSPVESVIGACLAVRRAFLPTLGLMDEDYFFYFEEIEWCLRARRLGYEVYHLPAARAFHGRGQTAHSFRNEAQIEYQRSKLIFYKKTRGSVVNIAVSVHMTLRAFVNALLHTVLCVATIFAYKPFKVKARVYWYSTAWHLLCRPADWGLPEKC